MARVGNSLVLFLALVSGLAAFAISLRLQDNPSAVVSPGATLVVVAVKDIGIGSMIQEDDVDLLPAPQNVNPKILFMEKTDVRGRVSRRNILKGEALKNIDLLAEGDNLASLIPTGYRAITIPVVLSPNLKSLLQIGNRLDVILTYEVTKDEINSVTLIENARVIGVSEPERRGMGTRGGEEVQITLAVSPEGAETLAYGMQKGTLTVSIRSLTEGDAEKFFTLKELFFPEDESEVVAEIREMPDTLPKDQIEVIRGVRIEQYTSEV